MNTDDRKSSPHFAFFLFSQFLFCLQLLHIKSSTSTCTINHIHEISQNEQKTSPATIYTFLPYLPQQYKSTRVMSLSGEEQWQLVLYFTGVHVGTLSLKKELETWNLQICVTLTFFFFSSTFEMLFQRGRVYICM